MIKVTFNPFDLIIACAQSLYPEIDTEITWVEGMHEKEGAWGAFEGGKDLPHRISIDVETPMGAAIEVLAHELAHAATGFEADHGPKWREAFDAIHAEYCRRVKEAGTTDGANSQ